MPIAAILCVNRGEKAGRNDQMDESSPEAADIGVAIFPDMRTAPKNWASTVSTNIDRLKPMVVSYGNRNVNVQLGGVIS
jgi:hypothetical protein